jgi:hypothetical protein
VLRTIIEGEPGIFPDPVARALRTIGGWFGHRSPAEPAAEPDPAGGTQPAEPAGPGDAPVTPTTPLDDDQSDRSK